MRYFVYKRKQLGILFPMPTTTTPAKALDVSPSNKTNRYSYRGYEIHAIAFGDPRNKTMQRNWWLVQGQWRREVWGGLSGAKSAVDSLLSQITQP